MSANAENQSSVKGDYWSVSDCPSCGAPLKKWIECNRLGRPVGRHVDCTRNCGWTAPPLTEDPLSSAADAATSGTEAR